MTGNRMSSLDLSQYCGLAAQLGEKSAGSRASVAGSAFHACCSDAVDKDDWLMKLTDEEAQEILGWHRPRPLEFVFEDAGVRCDYDDADKEATVALDSKGCHCEEDDPDCITVGHLDMAWAADFHDSKLAVIGDIKKSLFTVDGPDTLQLTAYALAWADKHGCDAYVTAIWGATEGRWLVGKPVSLLDAGDQWRRVKHAAQNVDERPTMGAHCMKCYGWQRCEAYTMVATDPLMLVGMDDDTEITDDNAGIMLEQADRLARVADLTKKRLKLWAQDHPISDGNGKVWKGVQQRGRESVCGVKKLRETMGKDAEKYISRGYEITSYRWVLDKGEGIPV